MERHPVFEMFDLSVSQAIDRYIDMKPKEFIHAIFQEWPEQMAIVLIVFMSAIKCPLLEGAFRVVYVERRNKACSYITLRGDDRGRP